jgi:hypothetical protein
MEMFSLKRTTGAAFVALATMGVLAPAQASTLVDLELVLAVDVSGSVDATEFNLQRQGYVNAFNDAMLYTNAIANGDIGQIAVTLVYWSSSNQQSQSVGWTLIDSVASSQAFAAAVLASARPFSGLTAPGSAINYAAGLFLANDYDGTRNVIDVSGDGAENDGVSTSAARTAFCNASADNAVNGIAILGESGLQTWYANNIPCGDNSFSIAASGFGTFEDAVKTKLVAEITGEPPSVVPLPAAGWLLLGGLGGMAALRRRKKAA